MIRKIETNELEQAAQYAYLLNSEAEHKCKAFPADYDSIIKQFKQILQHPADELLIATDDNTLSGLLALCVEPEEKYLEAIGGVFAHKDYQLIAREFYEYLTNNYKGYQFDAAYPEENKQAIEFMNAIGARLISYDYELRLSKKTYLNQPEYFESVSVIRLKHKYYDSFIKIHDSFHPDVYWNGERLIKALDKFDIFIISENDEVIGAVVTSNISGKTEEIYFIEVAENKQNRGLGSALISKALKHAFNKGVDELMIMVEKNNAAAIHLYEKFGFKKTDTCLTYSTGLM
jgi:ribosomal protein S18 acetylase RimI-like enzyme